MLSQPFVLGFQLYNTLAYRRQSICKLGLTEAWRDVLRAVPVERLQVNKQGAFSFRPVTGYGEAFREFGVIDQVVRLDMPVHLQPSAPGIVHEDQGGAVVGRQIANGNVLPVTPVVGECHGPVIQYVEKSGRSAAVLHIRPTVLRDGRHVEAVAGPDERNLGIRKTVESAATLETGPVLRAAVRSLCGLYALRRCDVEESVGHSCLLCCFRMLAPVKCAHNPLILERDLSESGRTMDRLDAMSLLVASVEEGSFSAAGRKLGVPLPTVSRKIAELEAHLKTRLLVRSTRNLSLTEAGIAYLAACRRILEQINDAETQASGEYIIPRGELTLTAPIVFGRLHVLPVVGEFLNQFNEINVRMILSDRNVNLVDDQIDVALRIGELPDSALVATRVGSIRRVVCGSPAYFAAHGTPKTPQDLVDHMCVTFSAISSGLSWTFTSKSGKYVTAVRPVCRLNINTAESAIDAATAGVGLTNVLSYQVTQAVHDGRLRIVLEDYEPDPIPVHLIHAGRNLLPLKMRSFLEFAAPRLRKSLAREQEKLVAPTTDRP